MVLTRDQVETLKDTKNLAEATASRIADHVRFSKQRRSWFYRGDGSMVWYERLRDQERFEREFFEAIDEVVALYPELSEYVDDFIFYDRKRRSILHKAKMALTVPRVAPKPTLVLLSDDTTIDITTGVIRKAVPDDLFTRQVPWLFLPNLDETTALEEYAREPDEDKKGSISFTMLVRETIAGHRAAASA